VPASALALALAAAFIHAVWNLLIARARDPEAASAVALLVAIVAYAPIAAVVWDVDRRVWPYIIGTGLLQLGYTAFLAAGYRRAELSVVYPVARGTAPVLVLVVGVLALGAGTSAVQAAGVCLVAAGILFIRGLARNADPTGLAFGLVVAGFIAAYTLVDKEGVRFAAPFAYLELSMLLPTFAYAGGLVGLRGVQTLRAAVNTSSVVAGLCTFGAYGLVLAALQRAPAAPVAAVRETSVLVAAALAALFLRERVAPTRWLGAFLIVGGVVLVAL